MSQSKGSPSKKKYMLKIFVAFYGYNIYMILTYVMLTIIDQTIIEFELLKCFTVSKWQPLNIVSSRHCAIPQNLRNHFPKSVFDEIWLKVADYQ